MLGNSAAAIHGAPVTTLDFDFMIRESAQNIKKLYLFAKFLKASIDQPYPGTSSLYRVINSGIGLQVDFITKAHGINSFAGLKSRAEKIKFNNYSLLIASLDDIIKSKTAANRPMDLAVLPVLKITNNEKKKNS